MSSRGQCVPTHLLPPQVDTSVVLSAVSDAAFQAQITRDHILEDTLHFLLPPPDTHLDTYLDTHLDTHQDTQTYQVINWTHLH